MFSDLKLSYTDMISVVCWWAFFFQTGKVKAPENLVMAAQKMFAEAFGKKLYDALHGFYWGMIF